MCFVRPLSYRRTLGGTQVNLNNYIKADIEKLLKQKQYQTDFVKQN
jgi:hypothetical protein